MNSRFTQRTIVVTGGASGIGAATTRLLVQEGASVVVLDRDRPRGETLVAELGSDRLEFILVDLSEASAIDTVAKTILTNHPAVHGLVNAAGILAGSNAANATSEDWQRVLAVNLVAPALLCRALLPALRAGGASIVNILSDGAFKGRPNGPYDASKAGLWSLTKSQAALWTSEGIRVNAVSPGWTATEIHYARAPDPAARREELLAWDSNGYTLMARLARPEEIARPIVFLLSSDASYINGTTLNVDGGRVGF